MNNKQLTQHLKEALDKIDALEKKWTDVCQAEIDFLKSLLP